MGDQNTYITYKMASCVLVTEKIRTKCWPDKCPFGAKGTYIVDQVFIGCLWPRHAF